MTIHKNTYPLLLLILPPLLLLAGCLEEAASDYEITTRVTPEESGTITVDPPDVTYPDGSTVTVTGVPEEGWRFDHWEVNMVRRNANPLTITMNSNKHVAAHFALQQHLLSITVEGDGTVRETVIQPKTTDYDHGTVVELEAIPANLRWMFTGWSGNLTGTLNPETVTIDREYAVTARFEELCCLTTYGGSGQDEGRSQVRTSDGGFVLTGWTGSGDGTFDEAGSTSRDIFLMKIGPAGELQWSRTFGGSGDDEAYSVIATEDGGFLVTGMTGSTDGDFSRTGGGVRDIFLLKTDASGQPEWLETYGGSGEDVAEEVIRAHGSGYLVTGWTDSGDGLFSGLNRGGRDIFLLKTGADGTTEWVQTFGGTGTDMASSVIRSSGQTYLFSGWSLSKDGDLSGIHIGDDYDLIIGRTDESGGKIWLKSYGGSGRDRVNAMAETAGGDIAIAGYTASPDGDFSGLLKGERAAFLAVTDSQGELQQVRSYGGSGNLDMISAITPSQSGGFLLRGSSNSADGDFHGSGSSEEGIFVIHTDPAGSPQWIRTFGGGSVRQSDLNKKSSIYQQPDGGIVLTGWSRSDSGLFGGLGKGESAIFFMELNGEGELTLPQP